MAGQTSGYYELRETRPRLLRIKEVLTQHMYTGASSGDGIPFKELEAAIQASASEIKAELLRIDSIEIDGNWWLLDAAFMADITDSLLDLVVEHDWPIKSVPCEECVQGLQAVDSNFTAAAARKCLMSMSSDDESTESPQTVALDEAKVCTFRAKQLLDAAEAATPSKQYELEEFQQVWKEKVLPGIEPEVETLRGLALLQPQGTRTILTVLKTEELPTDTASRFRKLFTVRAKWTREDLQPYLSDIIEPGQTEDQLLLKFTRVLQPVQGQPRLYATR